MEPPNDNPTSSSPAPEPALGTRADALHPGMVIAHHGKPGLVLNVDRGWGGVMVYVLPQGQHHCDFVDGGPRRVQTLDVPPSEWKDKLLHPETLASSTVGQNGFATNVGSDPELFVMDSAGVLIPAFMFLPPKRGWSAGNPEHVFYDGFQGELTTKATGCIGFLTDSVRRGMIKILAAARKVDPDATLSWKSVVDIPEAIKATVEKEHWKLGCEVSQNAYGEEPLQVDTPELLPFRSSGWHMHFGMKAKLDYGPSFPPPDQFVPKPIVPTVIKMLDRVVGLMGVTLGQGMHDPRRRHLYGRAGEYRNKRTIEYRVPEVLIGAHPAIFNLTWDLGRGAFWIGVKGFDFLFDAEDDEVRAAINEYDVPLALKILKRNEGFLKKLLTYSYGGPEHIHRHTFATIYEGIHHAVAKPTDLIGNWRLDAKWVNETDEDPETHRTGHLPGVTWSSTVKILETGNKV